MDLVGAGTEGSYSNIIGCLGVCVGVGIYIASLLFVQISQQKPTYKPTYVRKNVPEATRKKIYMASNGQ